MFDFFKRLFSNHLMASYIIWGFLVVCSSFATYANSYNNDYVIDDAIIVRDDVRAKSLDQTKKIFMTHYWQLEKDPLSGFAPTTYLYRPFSILTYAATASLWSSSPQAHHMINIILHTLTSFIIFLTIAIWFNSPALAGLTATLFAVHPIHVDAVNVLTGRSEILALLGAITVLFGIKKILLQKNLLFWYLTTWMALFFALCSKESAILCLPLLCLFILASESYYSNKQPYSQLVKQLFLKFGLPIISLLIPMSSYFTLRYLAIGGIGTNTGTFGKVKVYFIFNPMFDLPLYERVLTGIKIIGKYMALHVYPYPLLVDYSYNVIPLVKSAWDFTFLISCLALSLITVLLIFFRKEKLFVIGIIFWLIGIFLFSNIAIPFGTIFGERLMYFPSLGFCLAVASLIEKYFLFLKQKLQSSSNSNYFFLRVTSYIASAFIVLLSISYCIYSNPFYKNSYTSLLRAVELTNGQGAWHWFGLAQEYIQMKDQKKATEALEKCVEIIPYDPAYAQLTDLYFVNGNPEKALLNARKAVENAPDWWPYHKQLAIMLATTGNTIEAIKEFNIALLSAPKNSTIHISLGYLSQKQGNLPQAEQHFLQALEGDIPDSVCYKALAEIYSQQGKVSQAITYYETFIKQASPKEAKEVQPKLQELKYSLENNKQKS